MSFTAHDAELLIENHGVEGTSPYDHYETSAADESLDSFFEGDHVVGTARILGEQLTNVTIRHPEHDDRLQDERPPRHGHLARFTATIRGRYTSSDKLTLDDVTVTDFEVGTERQADS